MSTARAIAVVSTALRDMLLRVRNPLPTDPLKDADLASADVTTKPLDKARDGETSPQLNVFLYQVRPNAALRNADMRGQVMPGETAMPPLALDLFYLLTAYGQGDDDLLGHRLLGWAMSLLNEQPVLLASQLKAVAIPDNDLYRQVERVRFTPITLSTEELSKLWTAFATSYRVSIAYQASVVLIDSNRPARAPLPVLSRTLIVQAGLTLPSFSTPSLDAVTPPGGKPRANLGDVLTLSGSNLSGASTTVIFSSPLLDAPNILTPLAAGDPLQVQLPNGAADQTAWAPGIYAVTVSPRGDPAIVSNAQALALAPRITVPTSAVTVDASGDATITIGVSPNVWPDQSVMLLLGDRVVNAPAITAKTATLTFTVTAAPLGLQLVRLRVDGVDSMLVDPAKMTFDASQAVEIQK